MPASPSVFTHEFREPYQKISVDVESKCLSSYKLYVASLPRSVLPYLISLHPGILCLALPLGAKNMLLPLLSTRLTRPAVSWKV